MGRGQYQDQVYKGDMYIFNDGLWKCYNNTITENNKVINLNAIIYFCFHAGTSRSPLGTHLPHAIITVSYSGFKVLIIL